MTRHELFLRVSKQRRILEHLSDSYDYPDGMEPCYFIPDGMTEKQHKLFDADIEEQDLMSKSDLQELSELLVSMFPLHV